MKTQWQDNLSMLTKIVTVSYRIGERPWRSSSQSTPIPECVLENKYRIRLSKRKRLWTPAR